MKRANLRDFEETLRKRRLHVFSPLDIVRLFGWSPTAVRFLLHRYAKRGIVLKLRKGLYALAGVAIPDTYLANRLYEPSYVSLESALSIHGVIRETVYSVTSITARRTRRFGALGREFLYHQVQPRAFAGYSAMKRGDFTSLVALPEKALVDHYYLAIRGGRRPLDVDRLRLADLSAHSLRKYARLYNNKRLTQEIETLITRLPI